MNECKHRTAEGSHPRRCALLGGRCTHILFFAGEWDYGRAEDCHHFQRARADAAEAKAKLCDEMVRVASWPSYYQYCPESVFSTLTSEQMRQCNPLCHRWKSGECKVAEVLRKYDALEDSADGK